MPDTAFSPELIAAAAARLRGQVVTTPLLSSPMLDAVSGCHVLVKAESLQRTGAFKFRGALNKLLALPENVRARGIAAFSSGNHGHAVAAAASRIGCRAVIVLPRNAPQIKIDNCRWWGAQTVLYDPATEDRQRIGENLAAAHGMTLIPPFDDHDIIAGQATCGVELAQQCADMDAKPDVLIAPCSGGGLSAGVFAAVRERWPGIRTVFIEPQGSEKMAATLAVGTPQSRPVGHRTVMDGLSGPVAGLRPARILQSLEATGMAVSDTFALRAMALAFRTVKLVLEPAGAAALAAVLQHADRFQGQTVAIVCSGGNVNPVTFIQALQQEQGESA